MSDVFVLSERQMKRIEPFFPLAHGVPRVDEQDRLCDPQRPSVEGGSESVRSARDLIQSLHPTEPPGCL